MKSKILSHNKNIGDDKMTLVKFNPMRDLVNVEREFNKMFSHLKIDLEFPEAKMKKRIRECCVDAAN